MRSESREETALKETQQEAAGDELTKILHRTRRSHDNAPKESQGPQVPRRALESLQQDVRWNFAEDVGDEEDANAVRRVSVNSCLE